MNPSNRAVLARISLHMWRCVWCALSAHTVWSSCSYVRVSVCTSCSNQLQPFPTHYQSSVHIASFPSPLPASSSSYCPHPHTTHHRAWSHASLDSFPMQRSIVFPKHSAWSLAHFDLSRLHASKTTPNRPFDRLARPMFHTCRSFVPCISPICFIHIPHLCHIYHSFVSHDSDI